ncbi:MAG: hypothetical protein HKM02_09405 [Pseudomonadales bacterium]|nr:hypothetical protein [Pseudomonadales bacterium]
MKPPKHKDILNYTKWVGVIGMQTALAHAGNVVCSCQQQTNLTTISALPILQAPALTSTQNYVTTTALPEAIPSQKYAVGLDSNYDSVDGSSNSGMIGSASAYQGFHAGTHLKIMDILDIGSVTGAGYNKTLWQNGGGYRQDNIYLSSYGHLHLKQLDADLILADTHQYIGTQRPSNVGIESANTSSGVLAAELDLRYKFSGDNYLWGPLLSAATQHQKIGNIQEGQDLGSWHFNGTSITSTQYGAGIYGNIWRDLNIAKFPVGKIRAFASAQRLIEVQDQPEQWQGGPNAVPGLNIAYTGFNPGRMQNNIQIGISLDLTQNLSLGLVANSQQGISNGWSDKNIALGATGNF